MKWFAHYGGSSHFELMNEKEWNDEMEMLLEDECLNGEKITFMKHSYNQYDSLKEAKDYLLMHLQGELWEVRDSIRDIKRRRAK